MCIGPERTCRSTHITGCCCLLCASCEDIQESGGLQEYGASNGMTVTSLNSCMQHNRMCGEHVEPFGRMMSNPSTKLWSQTGLIDSSFTVTLCQSWSISHMNDMLLFYSPATRNLLSLKMLYNPSSSNVVLCPGVENTNIFGLLRKAGIFTLERKQQDNVSHFCQNKDWNDLSIVCGSIFLCFSWVIVNRISQTHGKIKHLHFYGSWTISICRWGLWYGEKL